MHRNCEKALEFLNIKLKNLHDTLQLFCHFILTVSSGGNAAKLCEI